MLVSIMSFYNVAWSVIVEQGFPQSTKDLGQVMVEDGGWIKLMKRQNWLIVEIMTVVVWKIEDYVFWSKMSYEM